MHHANPSRLSAECGWLLTQTFVFDYAAEYWRRHGVLPALGHLHMLYNRGLHPPVNRLSCEMGICDFGGTHGRTDGRRTVDALCV